MVDIMKLTIELIPRTAWFKNLRNYVKPSEWDSIRKNCYKKAGYRCEICNGKGNKHPVECHEIWEFSESRIILKGLIALCPDCHLVKHIGMAHIKGRLEYAKKHLMVVNNVSSNVADNMILRAFEQFHERSKYNWELDVGYLQTYIDAL